MYNICDATSSMTKGGVSTLVVSIPYQTELKHHKAFFGLKREFDERKIKKIISSEVIFKPCEVRLNKKNLEILKASKKFWVILDFVLGHD